MSANSGAEVPGVVIMARSAGWGFVGPIAAALRSAGRVRGRGDRGDRDRRAAGGGEIPIGVITGGRRAGVALPDRLEPSARE